MPYFDGGPWLQHVTDEIARIWFYRTDALEVVTAVLFPSGTSYPSVPGRNYVQITGLQPKTVYQYQLLVDGVPLTQPIEFVTMPTEGEPGRFIVIYLSDHHQHWPTSAVNYKTTVDARYAELLKYLAPHANVPKLCLMNGDHEIPQEFSSPSGTHDLSERIQQMSQMRQIGAYNLNRYAFHMAIPTYWGWDDWDYLGNNSAGADETAAGRTAARTVMRLFWDGLPEWTYPDTINYSFKVADCFVIYMDARTLRTQTPATFGQSGRADPDTWDPSTAIAWGATQRQWFKDQMTANASCFMKLIVNGDNWLDQLAGNAGGPGGRDSIGLFHRNERNELLNWLGQNPQALKGSIVLKGDDHASMVHYCNRWRSPEPYPPIEGAGGSNINCYPAASWPIGSRVPLPQIAGSFGGGPGAGDDGWIGHTAEKLWRGPGAKDAWIIHVDTTGGQPKAEFVLVGVSTPAFDATDIQRPKYRFYLRDGVWSFPKSGYRSGKDENGIWELSGYEHQQFTSKSTPSTTWSKKNENP